MRPRVTSRRLTLRIPFHRSSGMPPRKEARSVVRAGVAVRAKQIRKIGVRHMLRRPFQPGCLRGNSWPPPRVAIARRRIRPIWRHRAHRMFFILMASPFLAGQLRLPVWVQQLAPVFREVGMRLRAQNIFPVQFPPLLHPPALLAETIARLVLWDIPRPRPKGLRPHMISPSGHSSWSIPRMLRRRWQMAARPHPAAAWHRLHALPLLLISLRALGSDGGKMGCGK